MTGQNLFVAVAAAVLVAAGAATLTLTAAAPLAPIALSSSGDPQQLTRDGSEWFTNVAVKTVVEQPSVAAAAPGSIGVKGFVGVASTPLAGAPAGPAFATLYVSAAVVIAGTKAGATHVTTRLWMHGNAAVPGPLYTTPKGVEVGWLDAAPAVHVVPGMASDGWTPVEINGYLAANAVVDSLGPIWRAAEFNYEFVCADCHVPHAAADYTSMQWSIFMARMAKNAELAPDDAMFILKWLQTTAFASDVRK
jgi:hypothetical protein